MCGRFSFSKPIDEITAFYRVDQALDITPRYNIVPTQQAPVIVNVEGQRVLDLYRWGLIPVWAKDMKIGNKMINARVETVEEKPSYKRLTLTHRCLVPADGFYEWMQDPVTKEKTPVRILLKSEAPFAFAGLWDRWKDVEGEEIRSFTILTGPPNDLIKEVHNRMPIILGQADYEPWLDSDVPLQSFERITVPYPKEEMCYYPVSKYVNSPRNDTPECIQQRES